MFCFTRLSTITQTTKLIKNTLVKSFKAYFWQFSKIADCIFSKPTNIGEKTSELNIAYFTVKFQVFDNLIRISLV